MGGKHKPVGNTANLLGDPERPHVLWHQLWRLATRALQLYEPSTQQHLFSSSVFSLTAALIRVLLLLQLPPPGVP